MPVPSFSLVKKKSALFRITYTRAFSSFFFSFWPACIVWFYYLCVSVLVCLAFSENQQFQFCFCSFQTTKICPPPPPDIFGKDQGVNLKPCLKIIRSKSVVLGDAVCLNSFHEAEKEISGRTLVPKSFNLAISSETS